MKHMGHQIIKKSSSNFLLRQKGRILSIDSRFRSEEIIKIFKITEVFLIYSRADFADPFWVWWWRELQQVKVQAISVVQASSQNPINPFLTIFW